MAILFSIAAALAVSVAAPDYGSFKISDADFDRVTSHEYRKCLDESGGVTARMRDCSAAEFTRLDRALNIAYRDTLARLDPNGKAKLRVAERIWLNTRWNECDRQSAKEGGGTLALLIADSCGISEMARRTVWLQQYGGTQATVDVPANMRGVWGKHGRCDVPADRLTITSNRAGWGNGPFRPVDYSTDDHAIGWTVEGNVDNFVMGRTPNVLVHNTQGFHMPGEEGYTRCAADRHRMPWPPRN